MEKWPSSGAALPGLCPSDLCWVCSLCFGGQMAYVQSLMWNMGLLRSLNTVECVLTCLAVQGDSSMSGCSCQLRILMIGVRCSSQWAGTIEPYIVVCVSYSRVFSWHFYFSATLNVLSPQVLGPSVNCGESEKIFPVKPAGFMGWWGLLIYPRSPFPVLFSTWECNEYPKTVTKWVPRHAYSPRKRRTPALWVTHAWVKKMS